MFDFGDDELIVVVDVGVDLYYGCVLIVFCQWYEVWFWYDVGDDY